MGTANQNKRRTAAHITRRNVVAMASIFGSVAVAGLFSWSKSSRAQSLQSFEYERPHCFLRGTRIWTPYGECRIEDLQTNDLVLTSSGESKPIRWIGRRAHKLPSGQKWSETMLPIRVARSALGQNTPCRDLYLSQYHCLYLNGVLIPVIDLVNDSTIARSSATPPTIEYFHIKLDRHSVLYAEGAACETLLGVPTEYFEGFRKYGEPSGEPPFAPFLGYNGRRSILRGHCLSAMSPVIDARSKLEIVRDNLDERAAALST